jgi:hypothetical protein
MFDANEVGTNVCQPHLSTLDLAHVSNESVVVPGDSRTSTIGEVSMFTWVLLQQVKRYSKGAFHIFPQPQIHIVAATATSNTLHKHRCLT